nr:hypothetical protein [Micromonospora sp. DSM 115978]
AYVARTLIFPGRSVEEAAVMCEGAGVPRPVTVRPHAGQGCTYTYERSSAYLPDAVYNLTVESVWAVEYQNPYGSWTALDAQVPVTTLFRTPVHEVQTVVTSR